MEEKRFKIRITKENLPNFFYGGVLNIIKGLEYNVKQLFFVESCHYDPIIESLVIIFSNTKNKNIESIELDFKMNRLETAKFP